MPVRFIECSPACRLPLSRPLTLIFRLLGARSLYVVLAAFGWLLRMGGRPFCGPFRRPFARARTVGTRSFYLFRAAFGGFLGMLLALFTHATLHRL